MRVSLIISVYKKLRELELVLSALKEQTEKDFEVIIADDGSGAEIEDFINAFRKDFGYEITFITQEDKGFRKNKILNEAIKVSKSDYLIFLDCDCVPHPDFIKGHAESAEKNTVLIGRRVHLGEKLSGMLNRDFITTKSFKRLSRKAFLDSFRAGDSTIAAEEGLLVRNKFLRSVTKSKNNHIVGCNFSVWKEMMLKINGFDENYVGAGIGEDTDVEYRLGLTGAKFKSVRNLAVVFHLYHPKTKEANTNYDYFHKNVKLKNEFYCRNGIDKTYGG